MAENDPDDTHPDGPVMCSCSGTRRNHIRRLFLKEGKDMHAISRWTGALSGCGGCEWEIADFLKALEVGKYSGK